MSTKSITQILEFLDDRGVPKQEVSYEQYYLMECQSRLTKLGITASVGVRKNTGYFTAETWIYNKRKSTPGKPCWEKLFSPFGFRDYEEALHHAIVQGITKILEDDEEEYGF